jgi:accessory gene regulator B
MTERLTDRISRYFVLHGIAKEDDREVMAYVLFSLFATVQQLFALAVVAVALNAVPQTVAFTLCFAMLKRYAGGAHANKHWTCLTIFTVLTTAVCLVCKLVAVPPYVAVVASVVALVLVLVKAPVIHPNNPKSKKSRKFMRKISVAIAVAQCALFTAGNIFLPAMEIYLLPGALGGMAAAIALVLPMPENESP